MMLAHVSPVLIFSFLGCLVLGNNAALATAVGSFVLHRRRLWLFATSWLAIALGGSASGMYFDDGGGWHWMLALCLAPVIVGGASLIRFRSLRK
jgi:hypothetical protein